MVVDANPGWVRHELFPSGQVVYATPENVEKHQLVRAQGRAAPGAA